MTKSEDQPGSVFPIKMKRLGILEMKAKPDQRQNRNLSSASGLVQAYDRSVVRRTPTISRPEPVRNRRVWLEVRGLIFHAVTG